MDIVAEVLSKDTRSEMDMAFSPRESTQKSVLPKKEMVDSYSWFDMYTKKKLEAFHSQIEMIDM